MINPTMPKSNMVRVIPKRKGGTLSSGEKNCRTSARFNAGPSKSLGQGWTETLVWGVTLQTSTHALDWLTELNHPPVFKRAGARPVDKHVEVLRASGRSAGFHFVLCAKSSGSSKWASVSTIEGGNSRGSGTTFRPAERVTSPSWRGNHRTSGTRHRARTNVRR